jgi:hypothetical protein
LQTARGQGTKVFMTIVDRQRAIHHVVHDYANFVSSAEMVITGRHLCQGFQSPINTHLSHAFYLNCRKMADFFCKTKPDKDDVVAAHYVSTIMFSLPISDDWRDPINKQLAHITYARDTKPREITREVQQDLYNELKQAWKAFGKHLPEPYRSDFDREIAEKLKSEFGIYDLGW